MRDRILDEELKRNEKQKQVRVWLDQALKNWGKCSPEERHKIRDRLPGELAYLSESDRKDYITSICKKKIIDKKSLIKKVNDNVELYREIDGSKTKTKAESKIKPVTKTCIPGVVGLIKEDGRVKYLTLEEGILKTQDYIAVDGVKCEPKQDLPFFYPSSEVFFYFMKEEDGANLLADIEQFIHQYLELPNESGYLVLALWVLHTYLIEKFNYTPILYFYGILETGKIRAGEVLLHLVFKGDFEISPTEAVLFRSGEYFKPSLLLDELKIWGPEGNKEIARLLKSRYKRGLRVARCDLKHSKSENEIKYFDAFGPTVICSDQKMPSTLESRSFLFVMEKNISPGVESRIDEVKAQELRDRLTAFRARNLEKELPNPGKIVRRRLQEIVEPLHQILILMDKEREEELRNYVEIIREVRDIEESLTLQGEIINAIVETYQTDMFIGGKFLVSDITDFINKDRKEREQINSRTIGRIIRQLGYRVKRATGGKIAYLFDEAKTLNLAKRFGLETEPLKSRTVKESEESEESEETW